MLFGGHYSLRASEQVSIKGNIEIDDPYLKIAEMVLNDIKDRGGYVEYPQIESWALERGIGKYTLRTVVNDLIGQGKLKAPDGFFDDGEEIEPPVPKAVTMGEEDSESVIKLKEYFKTYWSVGMLRLFEDMQKAGIEGANEAVKQLVERGYLELSPTGVLNATKKLLGEDKQDGKKLSNLARL